MPFKSRSQEIFLRINKPKIAEEFADKTPKGKKLPKRVGKISRLLARKS